MKDELFSPAQQTFLARLGLSEISNVQWNLLVLAFIPPRPDQEQDNDRLEFLGDEALRLFASRFLYEHYPALSVGDLTTIRAQLVSNQYLTQWARHLGLAPCMPTGATASQLANALEAVIGALYLSTVLGGDLDTGDFRWITPWLKPLVQVLAEQVRTDPAHHNYKAALQEWTQHYLKALPSYELVAQASEPPPLYTYGVRIAGQLKGQGTAPSKRQAQQQAAQQAYQTIPPELMDLHALIEVRHRQCLTLYLDVSS